MERAQHSLFANRNRIDRQSPQSINPMGDGEIWHSMTMTYALNETSKDEVEANQMENHNWRERRDGEMATGGGGKDEIYTSEGQRTNQFNSI